MPGIVVAKKYARVHSSRSCGILPGPPVLERSALLSVINILAPVFLVIALGWVLSRGGFLSADALQALNRLTYFIGLPCVLFRGIARARPELEAVAGLLTVAMAATLLGMLAAWLVALWLRLPASSRGAFLQGSFRGNLVFIGLPVVLYAFAGGDEGIEATALLLFGPLVVLYNVLAVSLLLYYGDGAQQGMLRVALRGMLTNPILLACLGGLIVSLSGLALPQVADRTLAALGQMALPLALICIGGSLYTTRLQGGIGPALAASLVKVGLLPLIGLPLALWMELPAEHTRMVLLLLACPTAAASYVLVSQLRGDSALASSIIVLSSLLAVPALAVVLAITA